MKKWYVFILLASSLAGSLIVEAKCPRWTKDNLAAAAQKSFESVLNSDLPTERVRLVQEGLKWANGCVASFPEVIDCYYYRALLQGIETEQQGFGFQKKLAKMMKDLEKVHAQLPEYDFGGAARTMGYIYLKSPEFSFKKKGITRDLDKAEKLAQEALGLAPFNLDNRFLWAQVLVAQNKLPEAQIELSHLQSDFAKIKAKNRQQERDFKEIQRLLKKIAKKNSKD